MGERERRCKTARVDQRKMEKELHVSQNDQETRVTGENGDLHRVMRTAKSEMSVATHSGDRLGTEEPPDDQNWNCQTWKPPNGTLGSLDAQIAATQDVASNGVV